MKIKRLALFMTVISFCLNLCFSPAAVNAAFDVPRVNEQLNTTVIPNHVALSWTDDPKTTQTITWSTSTIVNKGLVQYREIKQEDKYTKNFNAGVAEKFVTAVERNDAPGEMNIFSATLKGLKVGKTYTYRVGDGQNWSEYSTFTTENPALDSFKMLLFADSQNDKADYQVWHDTLFSAYGANKDAKFFVTMGDQSDQGQNFYYFNNWFDAATGVINKIPDMPLMGNHECRDGHAVGKDSVYGDPTYYLKLFKLPNNGPEGYKGKAYSYDYGNAHFTVLDSQIFEQYKTEETREKGIQAQIAWLDKDLSTTDKAWKFVLYHRPQYYLKTIRTSTYMKAFEPTFDKYHVDMVLHGHDHGMARTYPIKNGEYMSKPSEGTVYFVTGRTNLNTKSDISPKVWNAFAFDPQDLPVYQTAEISKTKLIIKTFEQNGRLVDNFVIDKANPDNSTITVPSGKLDEARLVVFGNAITWGAKPVKDKNGSWYVDLSMIASVMDAKYDKEKNTLTYKKPKQTVTLTDDMFKDGVRKMISLDGLRQLGFECIHQEKTNLILVEKISNS